MILKKWIIIIIFLSTLVLGYNFLLSDFNPIFDDDQFKRIKLELQKDDDELDPIIEIYEEINNAIDKKDYPCRSALYNVEKYRSGSIFKKALFELKISRDFTKSQCKRFELQNLDFPYKQKGIKEAAKFYFSKNLNQLSKEQLITLLVMSKNPSLYNPFKRKEILMKKVRKYNQLIKEKNSR